MDLSVNGLYILSPLDVAPNITLISERTCNLISSQGLQTKHTQEYTQGRTEALWNNEMFRPLSI